MSRKNGDKSRFHRQRKQRIERRMRQRKLFLAGGVEGKTGNPSERHPEAVLERNARISLTESNLKGSTPGG